MWLELAHSGWWPSGEQFHSRAGSDMHTKLIGCLDSSEGKVLFSTLREYQDWEKDVRHSGISVLGSRK